MMRLVNKTQLAWSLVLCLMIPHVVPSAYESAGRGSYSFGLPFEFITIYQLEPGSGWFFTNFFSGNDGMFVSIGALVLNVLIIYGVVRLIARMTFAGRDKKYRRTPSVT
ncbi:hypothetical protein [Bacillus daqingensis]|uniref:hypothetical protein n=1 Tax=Bacillus daqingensis TaxID=872396 RepID=UPI003F8690D8